MADSLSMAFLVLLERLSPEQRAVLLLRDVFDYGYGEIAGIVGKTEPTSASSPPGRAATWQERRHALPDLARAARRAGAPLLRGDAQEGDLGALEALLAHDVVLHGDGGGKVPALARALRPAGPGWCARWWRGRGWAGATRRAHRQVEVNGQPGGLVLDGSGAVIGVMALDIAGGRITAVRSVVNPDKLAHLGQVGDMRRTASSARA
jgi:RNA polymerase sigma-70 factor (ECF subfamily)